MLLADHITQQVGDYTDLGGMITGLARGIGRAQRFVMHRDTTEACMELMRARPSNMVKALPLCRLPYQAMWIETQGGFSENHRDPTIAPVPTTQGTLIEGYGEQRGVMTVAWVHPPNAKHPGYHCNASPYGLWFDFSDDADAPAMVRDYHQSILDDVRRSRPQLVDLFEAIFRRIETTFGVPVTDAEIVDFMHNRSWWARWANDPREIEAIKMHDRHMRVGISPHGLGAVLAALDLSASARHPNMFASMMHNWERDIEGEGPFAQFFITLMNSKNSVAREPVSMAKLNKARAKRGKRPVLDYTTIKLTMPRSQARAGAAQGLSREAMRQHLVRGHFKIRKSGVYWWSPFVRGDAAKPTQRQRYEVDA